MFLVAKNFLIYLWSLWSLVITISLFFLLLPFNVLLIFCLGNLGKEIFVRYTSYLVGNVLIFLFGMYKRVTGFYPLSSSKPCIYVVNHKSYLDVVIVASLIPYKIKYLGKSEVFNWPLFGFLAKHSGQIPVQRKNKESRQKGYELMKEAINNGYSIILFPEGGWRNKGDHRSENPYGLVEDTLLQEFRNGAFRLAIETQVSIIPIVLLNAQKRFSDLTMRIVPGIIKIHICKALDSRFFKDSLDLNHTCHALMLEKLKQDML